MAANTNQRNKSITYLLNGTNSALRQVIPIDYELSKPNLQKDPIQVGFGVFIGIVGDIKGKLVLVANKTAFGTIGQVMFGMPIEGEMLSSFSGELGNMLAGNVSTFISNDGLDIDITSPSIIEGDAKVSGYVLAIQQRAVFVNGVYMDIYLLLDE